MSYTPHTWVTGETITADKLNNMEGGISNNDTAISGMSALISETFATNKAYSKGDYVIYQDALYRFTANHSAGAWTGTDVTQVVLADEVTDVNNAINGSIVGYKYVMTYTSGKYIDKADGSEKNDAGSMASSFVPIGDNVIALLPVLTTSEGLYNAFYDANKNFINAPLDLQSEKVTVPVNAKYFRISKFVATDNIDIYPILKVSPLNKTGEYNCENEFYWVSGVPASATSNGVKVTAIAPSIIDLKGTATGTVGGYFYQVWNTLPCYFPKGETVFVKLYSELPSAVELRINIYENGSAASTWFKTIQPNTLTPVVLPDTTTGLSIYLRIPSGTAVNGSCSLYVNRTKTNKQLTTDIDDITEELGQNYYTLPLNQYDTLTNVGLIQYSDGSINTYANGRYSDPVAVKKGDIIQYKLMTNGSAYCMLCSCKSDGTYIKYLVVGTGSLAEGTYNITEDGYVRFGGRVEVMENEYIRIKRLRSAHESVLELENDIWNSLSNFVYKTGVVGDSYSAIRLYSGGGFDSPFYSWVSFLQRKTGMVYNNFSGSGYDCNDWINGTTDRPEKFTEASQSDKLCQLYLVCMGINDCARNSTTYIGTTADINVSNPDNNANSFIGNYAKIIQKLHAVQTRAKFICFTMPTYTTDNGLARYEAYNSAIKKVADFFDYAYLADLYTDHYDLYHSAGSPLLNPGGAFVNNGHYTATVEPIIADIMSEEVSKVIYNNQADFAQLETMGSIWQPT